MPPMKKSSPPSSPPAAKAARIAWHIARCGLCSRRDAEKLIAAGRVKFGGEVVTIGAVAVDSSPITVDDKPLPPPLKARLWLYHKPSGLITTARDTHNRRTVFDDLAAANLLPRVLAVGRLDRQSEGLLLLTNDGHLARRLTLPQNAVERRYRVQTEGEPHRSRLAELADGVTINRVRYAPIKISKAANGWYNVILVEGKNREIRRMMKWCNLRVMRLIRVGFGDFKLGDLKVGQVTEVSAAETAAEMTKASIGMSR